MKRIIPISILILFLVFVFFKLRSNKKIIDAQTALSESYVENIPVKTFSVGNSKVTSFIKLSGKLASEDEMMIISSTEGRIANLFKKKGDWIDKGQILLKVEDELYKEDYTIKSAAYEKIKKDLERLKNMNAAGAATDQDVEGLELQLKAAEAQLLVAKKTLNDASIKAPISGYVNQLFAKEGGLLGKGTPVAELVNTSSFKLKLKASETDIPAISNANKVKVVVPSYPLDTLVGTVSFTSVKADYSNRYEVEVSVDTDNKVFKAGMLGNCYFYSDSNGDNFLIPKSAILELGSSRPYVYIIRNDKAVQTEVVTGTTLNNYVTILSGLNTNDLVIVKGNNIVQDGSNVQIVEE